MSTVTEIGAFLRLAKGGLSPETLAKAIRRRWPDASEDEVREALSRAAAEAPSNSEEQIALDAAARAMLRG